MHAAVLECANHFQTRAIAYVTKPFISVAAKCALQNISVGSPIEKRAPLFKFPYPLGRFLRMYLGHAPVVQELAAAHRVAKVRAPIVGSVDIGHCRRDAAFSHHGVRFAEQRFAHNAYTRALGQRLDRSAQTGATRADNQNVVLVGFVFFGHRNLKSAIAPDATRRTYRSASPTENRLSQANSMWRSLRKETPRHALCRGPPATTQEKQSTLPPTMCLNEWHDSV